MPRPAMYTPACDVCPGLRMYTPACDVCPGLRMASPSQTCSPLRLSSLPTAIGRPGYSADDTFIPRTPDLSRAKISASFLLWFAYGEATTPALCYAVGGTQCGAKEGFFESSAVRSFKRSALKAWYSAAGSALDGVFPEKHFHKRLELTRSV